MSTVTDFVQKFIALVGKKVTVTQEMTDLATEFYNSTKEDTEKMMKEKQEKKEKKEKKKEKKEKKEKGKKEKKTGPKKPLNGYMLFSAATRLDFKEKNPEMNPKELTSKIAKQWNEEKDGNTPTYQKYAKMAEEASEKYKEAKASESENSENSESDSEEKVEKKEKKEKKEKRAPSAYNIFYSRKYAELSSDGKKNGEIMKEISALWKAMSAEEKEAYKGQELNTEKVKVEADLVSSPPKTKEVKGKKGAKEVKV